MMDPPVGHDVVVMSTLAGTRTTPRLHGMLTATKKRYPVLGLKDPGGMYSCIRTGVMVVGTMRGARSALMAVPAASSSNRDHSMVAPTDTTSPILAAFKQTSSCTCSLNNPGPDLTNLTSRGTNDKLGMHHDQRVTPFRPDSKHQVGNESRGGRKGLGLTAVKSTTFVDLHPARSESLGESCGNSHSKRFEACKTTDQGTGYPFIRGCAVYCLQ